eukprot:129374-Chlamydomonas_euryale.AAC.1
MDGAAAGVRARRGWKKLLTEREGPGARGGDSTRCAVAYCAWGSGRGDSCGCAVAYCAWGSG